MTSRLHQWCLVCCAAFLVSSPAGAETRLVKPFVRQISLTDFQLLETNNDLVLSPTHSLVLCFTTSDRAGKVSRALALRPRSRDVYVLSYLVAQPATGADRFQQQEIELPAEIARNVLACFRDLMAHGLLRSAGGLHVPSGDDDAWIFLRSSGNQTVTGVALNSALHSPGDYDNVTIYRDLCAGLVGMFVYPEERNVLLKQLDRFAAVYVRTNGLNPR